MRLLIFIGLIFSPGSMFSQQIDSKTIVHKQQKHYLTKTCFQAIYWDEIATKSATVNNKINSSIRKAIAPYKLTKKDAIEYCGKRLEYETDFTAVYAKNGLLSYDLSSYSYGEGALHGWREFSTLNFNTSTGALLQFIEFIKPCKRSELDSLVLYKLKESYNHVIEPDLLIYEKQLPQVNFLITEKGIQLLFKGDRYITTMLEVSLSYAELEGFVNKQGYLKYYYKQ